MSATTQSSPLRQYIDDINDLPLDALLGRIVLSLFPGFKAPKKQD